MSTRWIYRLATLAIALNLTFALAARAQAAPPVNDHDTTRAELDRFDDFMDHHPGIAKDVRANPSLLTNRDYLEDHKELADFLKDHPGVREEVRENPKAFMRAENRFEKSGQDITRGELDRFDDFMDRHPGIAKDVRQNPSLLNDKNYLSQHKELADFMEDHPGVREEVRENPARFMNRERTFEAKGGDIDRGELARADQFFDNHPGVYNELKKNPRLVDDPNYLAKHPELQEFLQTHPEIRSDIKSHPKVFMAKERKYERREEKNEKPKAFRPRKQR